VLVGSATRAIITGASRGIGRATAQAFAARGATVGLLARDKERLEELAEELGEKSVVLAADVSKRGQVERAVARFCRKAGGLDVLVANAGLARYAPYADQELDDIEQMVKVNVFGVLYTVRAGLPFMLDAAQGHVVVVSSGAGLRAFPSAAVYGATKAANRAFAEALRHELSGTGVSVSTVFPGEVATDLHEGREARLPDWRDSDEAIPAGDVATAIMEAVEGDQRAVYVPRQVRILGLNGVAPRLTDRLLATVRGGTAAPRRD
jgi:short-subunit dehydrogenase